MPDEIKDETTNKVLEVKIDGLSRLTDERFSNIKETLLRIESHSSNFATKAELNEVKKDFTDSVKRIEDSFHKHNEDDKISFGGLMDGQQKLRDTIRFWGGGLAIIGIILPFFMKFILNYWFK